MSGRPAYGREGPQPDEQQSLAKHCQKSSAPRTRRAALKKNLLGRARPCIAEVEGFEKRTFSVVLSGVRLRTSAAAVG